MFLKHFRNGIFETRFWSIWKNAWA